ncbi:hypothetical protein MCOR27_004637 [Pyricularia oryzae]|uniref:SWIM-type domain-containing protein n=1 Tax=Pyricularia grisea TaxID=148305 RepID=A0ABQ8P0Y8_PYRGI|nr:hypothetical protein MCOR01_009639 [Pyricularia oryzae]KAI6303877.1 hypothetical protein MCOR33_001046 [Pyricularia grisea]KAH9437091.1 hypothetical protein MCOR02_000747 [Pyricularia oryzae]KAI6261724.1 hypothetical protein MCOR19_002054 [Pyricularia oryzae]KAI6280550.1 hypothetical protein MCOR27_004637 [Pyricularia oryzae]
MANRRHRPSKKNRASRQKAAQQNDGETQDYVGAKSRGSEVIVLKYYTPHPDNAQARGRSSSVPYREKPGTLFTDHEEQKHEEEQSAGGERGSSTPARRWSCSASLQRGRSPSSNLGSGLVWGILWCLTGDVEAIHGSPDKTKAYRKDNSNILTLISVDRRRAYSTCGAVHADAYRDQPCRHKVLWLVGRAITSCYDLSGSSCWDRETGRIRLIY